MIDTQLFRFSVAYTTTSHPESKMRVLSKKRVYDKHVIVIDIDAKKVVVDAKTLNG